MFTRLLQFLNASVPISVTDEGIVVTELHPDYTKEEVQEATGVELIWSPDLKPYDET